MHVPVKASPPSVTVRDDQAALYAEMVNGHHADGHKGRVIFCVSTSDLDEGKGDPYVALGLAKFLIDHGWGVSLWPRSRWHETPSPMPTTAIVMVESFIPGMLPAHTATIAWIRNWASAWAELPYLDEFDGVWCSSQASADVIAERYAGDVAVVPIGVDLELFTLEQPLPRSMPVITTANFWGAERGIQTALTELSRSTPVTWFGSNGEHLVRSSTIAHADKVPFFGLPSVYGQSLLVIDDLIDAARVYGNHNSRLYEAIACGAVPITNTDRGLDELGLSEVPTYSDEASLAAVANALLADRPALATLSERLRSVVTERHSYRSRAEQVSPLLDAAVVRASHRESRSALLAWSTAERKRLQDAEALRDGHLITVRRLEREISRIERELVDLRRERDALVRELQVIRGSRLQRAALKASEVIGRVRQTITRSRSRSR